MRFKHLYFSTPFLFLTISFSFGQYYPVPNSKLDISVKQIEVKSFSLSSFVTVKEFKKYLKSIEKDSSKIFYKSQLPYSRDIKEEMVKEILNNEHLQNKPMPCVSWTIARNYCKWLTNQSKSNGNGFTFELPLNSEIIAYNNLYGYSDTNELQTWTLNMFYDNALDFSELTIDQYNAGKNDPPSMKRKVIYGSCYLMNNKPTNSNRNFHFEYQDSSSRYVGFRIVRRTNNPSTDTLNINNINVDYSLNNNKLSGVYQEKYLNGKTKVIGFFTNGQRSDIWTIWDENGNLKIQRNYYIDKTFDFIIPKTNFPYKEIYQKYPEYILKKNEQNIYPYLFIEERMVVYSKRIYRELITNNESELFQKIDFKDVVQDLVSNKVKWYKYGENGQLKTEVSKEELEEMKTSFVNWDFSRIEIKEDFFFNIDNLKSDTRQIAISFYKTKENIKPEYSIYFPHARKILAQTTYSSFINEVKTLDDFFFFHLYRGNIVKSSNVFDRPIKGNTEDLKIEFEKYIAEHNLWITYGR
jgi:hypothetical protein